MATVPVSTPVTPTKRTSVLAKIGKDIKAVFSWLGSAHGQAVIVAGETAVESVFPAAQGIIALANAGLIEAIKIESLAAAAGQQSGSGTQKLAALVSTLTPEFLAYAESNKFPVPTADNIQNAANALVAFLDSFDAGTATPTTPAPAVAVPA